MRALLGLGLGLDQDLEALDLDLEAQDLEAQDLEALDLDQDIQALDLEALDLDLVPHLFLPLVAMEQVGNSAESSSSFSVLECKFYPPFLFLPYTKRGQVRKVKSCWTNI